MTTVFSNEVWANDDPRFPADEQMMRVPPEKQFLESVRKHGIIQPICMGLLPTGEWVMAFGRKRLMAARQVGVDVRVQWAEMDEDEVNVLCLVENAQRAGNPISDYVAIKTLLFKNRTYKEIAEMIGKPITYVKTADKTYANVPQWSITAALEGKMALTVVESIGKLSKSQQEEAHQIFQTKGALAASAIDQMKRFQVQAFSIQMAQPIAGAVQQKKPFVSRNEVQKAYDLLIGGNKKQGLALLEKILQGA
jgi:ParB/RepB/Spo0J family partition protein